MSAITTLPELFVVAGGRRLDEVDQRHLAGLRVRHALSVPAQAELRFLDPPSTSRALQRFVPGTELRVAVTHEGGTVFSGDVTAVEEERDSTRGVTIRVRAYDRLHRLRKRGEVRTFTSATAGDVVSELTSDLGLPVRVQADGPRWPAITQGEQSDLAFLTELTRAAGLHWAVVGGELELFDATGTPAGRGDRTLTVGEDLWEARVEVNADRSAASVEGLGWDATTFEPRRGRATAARSGRRVRMGVDASAVGAGPARVLLGRPVPSDEVAGSLAQAELDRRCASLVTLSGVTDGASDLYPGTGVEIRGLSPELSGRYVLSAVEHTVDEHGYLTQLESAPPAGPTATEQQSEPRGAAQLAPGAVVDVADPDGLGRVRVELPALDGTRSRWLPVLLPGVGASKGLVALPDVGDRVLVLLPDGRGDAGVVLGSTFAPEQPDDTGVEDTSVRRYLLTTPGGHRVVLDDEAGTVSLEASNGSHVEMGPESMTVYAATDLTITAPGRAMTLSAATVDFEQV